MALAKHERSGLNSIQRSKNLSSHAPEISFMGKQIKAVITFTSLLATTCIIALSGTAQANELSRGTGQAITGTGTLGDGEVTVFHNFIPADRQSIDDDIAALKARLNAIKAESDQGDEALKHQAANIEVGSLGAYDKSDSQVRCNDGDVTIAVKTTKHCRVTSGQNATTEKCNYVTSATRCAYLR